jgi:hypothetical protein
MLKNKNIESIIIGSNMKKKISNNKYKLEIYSITLFIEISLN